MRCLLKVVFGPLFRPLGTLVVALLAVGFFGADVQGQTVIAQDSATNAAYNTGFGNSNSGTGFGPWSYSGFSGTGISAGRYISNTNTNGTAGGMSGFTGRAWALFANPTNSGAFASVARTISNGLAVGQVFSFRWGLNFDSAAANGNKGFRLLAGGTNVTNTLLNLSMSNSPVLRINGAQLTAIYGSQSFVVNIERRTASQLRVYGTGRNGTEGFDVVVPLGTNTPDTIQWYAYQMNTGTEREPRFSDFQIVQSNTPSATPSNAVVTIAGSFQGWNAAAIHAGTLSNNVMSAVPGQPNAYTLNYYASQAGSFMFKFTDGTFTGPRSPWGTSSLTGFAMTQKGSGGDIPLVISNKGMYAFQFNTATLAYSVSRASFGSYADFAAAYQIGADTEDADADGLSNGQEYALSTDPLAADTDGDGLTDLAERDGAFGVGVVTNPLHPDTDGDGLRDGWEVSNGLDPTDDGSASSFQNYTGLTVSSNPNGANSDPDNDGRTNLQEQTSSLNPRAPGGLASAYSSMVVAGNFNVWNPGVNDIFRMNLTADWTWEGLVYFSVPPSDPRFQFAANGSWADKWGEDNDPADGVAEKNTNTGHIRGLTNVITSSNPWARVTLNELTRAYTVTAMPSLDGDNDGLPDYYESFYGARLSPAVTDLNPSVDSNGDGLTNLQNYQAGSLPVGIGSPNYQAIAQRWKEQHLAHPERENTVLFLGSSSIRRWESLKRDLADFDVIQRGMGGSNFEDLNQLIHPFAIQHAPRAVVIWSGLNDIYNGGSAEMVFERYLRFTRTMNRLLPNTKIFYLGMTLNPSFAANASQNTERLNANAAIQNHVNTGANPTLFYIDLPASFDGRPVGNSSSPSPGDLWALFVDDKHLNREGYLLWKNLIRSALVSGGVVADRLPVANALAPSGGQRILFDFGPTDSTHGDATLGEDANGNVWNNWHAGATGGSKLIAGEKVGGLIDTKGSNTGVILTLTGDFGINGKLTGGLMQVPSQALGYLGVASATQDFFYAGADNQVGGGDDDISGGFMISGLNPALRYDLRLFGSRAATDIRRTFYEIHGASSQSLTLQTTGAGIGVQRGNGNDQTVAAANSVSPNAFGEIFVDLSAMVEPGNSNIFGYLNAMELSVVSPYEAWARSKGLVAGVDQVLAGGNLEQFALDGSTVDALGNQAKIRGLTTSGPGAQALHLAMPVRKGTSFSGSTALSGTQDGVTYEVVGSSDLINWNLPVELVSSSDTTGLPSLADPSGYEYRRFRIKDLAGTMTKGFLKSVIRSSGASDVPAVAGKNSVSAAAYSSMQGVQVSGGTVGFFDGGDWLRYSGVDLGNGVTSVTFSASKSGGGGSVEIRLGSPTGRLIGTFTPQDTGGWGTYREQLVQLSGFASGVQDLYLVAAGGTGVCNLDSFRFSQYVLTWSDEFSGSSLNTNNWAAVDNGDVANGELQFYTPRTNNVSVTNGVLQLTAQREAYTGQGPWMSAPKTTAYTSGLVESLNKVEPQYGKIEASMKIPRGAGLWPAFWMMGVNYFTPGVGWPACGEIDIMEYSGNSGSFTAAFHTGAYNYMNGGGGITNVQGFSLGDYDTAFHVYGIEWTPTRVAFYVDGKVILEAKKSQMGSSAAQWPFDQPFWLKLNLAIGGPYGGDPSSGVFPKTMEVDWVRVYQEQPAN